LIATTNRWNSTSDIADAAFAFALRSAEKHILSEYQAWFVSSQRLTITSQLDNRLVVEFLLVYIKGRQLQRDPTSNAASSEFITAVCRMVEAMTEAADAGLIWLWFDANIATFPPIGLWLYKASYRTCDWYRPRLLRLADHYSVSCLFVQFAIDHQGNDDLVIRLLRQMQHNCRNVEGLGGSPSCTLIGKFFDRLVKALLSQTQEGSRLELTIDAEDPMGDWTLMQFVSDRSSTNHAPTMY
jgi:hypothetical protein